jgi:hypothetical protein
MDAVGFTFGTLPDRRAGNEADDTRNTFARVGEPVGAEVLGERKHVPLCRRKWIEPAATVVDDDDDPAVTAILDRPAGALLDVDLPPILLKQGRTADLFAQLFDFSFVHIPAPGSPQAMPDPFFGWCCLFRTSRNTAGRPRSLPDARAR